MGVDSLNRVGAQTGGCLLQLRLAGCRCGTAHLRGPSGGEYREFGSTRASCEAATPREGQPTSLMVHLVVQV